MRIRLRVHCFGQVEDAILKFSFKLKLVKFFIEENMSGSRHHIIPRFLIKGFATEKKSGQGFYQSSDKRKKKNQQFYTVVYEYNKSYPNNIKNVFVEKLFYGEKGEANCDDKITEQEQTYSRAIDQLRNESKSIPIKEPIVSEFVCHLAMRSHTLRQFSTKMADFTIEEISKSLSSQHNIIKLMESEIKNRPNFITEEFQNKFGREMTTEEKQYLNSVLENNPNLISNYIDSTSSELQGTLLSILESINLKEETKTAHNKALLGSTFENSKLQELNWYLVVEKEGYFVLGDTPVICQGGTDNQYRPFPCDLEPLWAVYLPISSHHLIVGTQETVIPTINSATLNTAVIKCSSSCFIAEKQEEFLETSRSEIGKYHCHIEEKELNQILSQALGKYGLTSE